MISQKIAFRKLPWLWIIVIGLFSLSAVLRFWGLSRFNTLVFDEVYFAKFANNYLTNTPFFDGHPPLGKYLIALGIWINTRFPFGDNSLTNELTGSMLSTFSYRWMNAFIGSLIPVVVAGIAYQLSGQRSYAAIAGFLTAADGLFLVESRYALVNVHLVFLGLLGQWFFLLGLKRRSGYATHPRSLHKQFYLILSGACFGASAAVKWNGLGFLLGIYLIWIISGIIRLLHTLKNRDCDSRSNRQNLWQYLTGFNVIQFFIYLGIIPFFSYSLTWLPHLKLSTDYGFWKVHQKILTYHQGVGNTPDVHPYCSSWYSWPLMLRSVAYFHEKSRETKEIIDVHAMGNPCLWWLSTAAIAVLIWLLIKRLLLSANWELDRNTWMALYLVLNHAANWLPWMKVSRCLFIYHYMGAAVFGFMAIALFINQWLKSPWFQHRILGVATLSLIMLAFIYWLPIYLGLPLSPVEFKMRMWFRSWI